MLRRSDAFENPVIRHYNRNREALAQGMMAPVDTEDPISKMQTNKQSEILVLLLILQLLLVLSSYTFRTCLSLFVSVTVPKVEQINHRLGHLAEEFKCLVYPPGYNPENKQPAKRKTGQSCSQNTNYTKS